MKKLFGGFTVLMFILCLAVSCFAVAHAWAIPTAHPATINFSWNAVVVPDLAGYKIHYGVASNTYSTTIDVGNVLLYTISDLAGGETYYFNITSYDDAGHESPYCAELVHNPPPIMAEDFTSNIVDGNIVFQWSANTNSDFKEYRLYKRSVGSPEFVYPPIWTGVDAAVVTTSIPYTEDSEFMMKVCDTNNQESVDSAVIVIDLAPPIVQNFKIDSYTQ